MRVRCGPVRLLPALPGLVLGLSLGCGAHLHRPHDAAAAEQAEVELKGARLTEGFAPELALAADSSRSACGAANSAGLSM